MNEGLKIRVLETKEEMRRVESVTEGLKNKIEYKKDMIQKIEEKSESQFQSYKKQESDEQATLDDILSKKIIIFHNDILLFFVFHFDCFIENI